MFVSLWHYFGGYVIVEITGFSIERLMNLAIKNNIELWDAQKVNGVLYFKTTIEGFKALKPYVRKTRCRVKIKGKKGIPFKTFRYKKRVMLVFGAALFVTALMILSSFVWLVEVEGNQTISETDIISSLEKAGYTTGKLKSKLDLRAAESYLINKYPEIVWVGIKFEGTRLLVEVAETVPKPQIVDDNTPCNIVAKRDGLITYIATYKGMPQVKKGDIVRKGEVLVAGEGPLMEGEPLLYYTRAKAVIRAKTVYSLSGSIALSQMKKDYTHNVAKSYCIKILNKKIPLYRSKKMSAPLYDTLITNQQLKITKYFPLPFYFEKEERIEYNLNHIMLSEEDAKEKLFIALWEKLNKQIHNDVTILSKNISYTKTDKGYTARLNVVVEEDIGEAVDLQKEGEKNNE